MGYCTSCGAYIPDGQTKCLACGYDEAAREQKSSGQAAQAAAKENTSAGSQRKYRQFDSDFLRQQLDEQRKRQQENNRKWAETEYAQRQKAKEEQARNFTNTSRSTDANRYKETVKSAVQSADQSKLLAGMSYISGLFLVPMLFAKDDQFASFHAKQGLNLFVAGILGDIAGSMLGVGWIVTLARLYMIFQGISNVANGRKRKLPYIGEIFK